VSPAWGRFAITELVLAQRRWLCDELASRGLTANSVIVADDGNIDIAREYGFEVVEKDNRDLGMRFNVGYRAAARMGADVFVHVGSDDWVHPDVFNVLLELDPNDIVEEMPPTAVGATWKKAPTLIAQNHLTAVDLTRGVGRRLKVNGRYGCIPWLIARETLKPFGFMPIATGNNRGIDGALVRGISRFAPNWRFQEADPLWLVDFKSDTNVTAYRTIADALGMTTQDEDPWEMLATAYPMHLVEKARSLVGAAA